MLRPLIYGLAVGTGIGWLIRDRRAKRSIEVLKSLDELRKDFVSTVSHELRTPLTSIGGFVKLIAAGDAGPVTETQAEFLDIVDKNVDRLTSLINDILDVEKIESGNFQMVHQALNLRDILIDVVENIRVLAAKKKLTLNVQIPDQALWVEGDRIRLMQIFENLLSNAIKYTRVGTVSLEVEKYELAVMIRVRDSGIGISEQDQERLFQKFFRTEESLTLADGGTGLGLTIVKALVDAHHGQIAVESEIKKGSTFTVTLPLDADRMQENLRERNFFKKDGLERPVWLVGLSDSMSQLVEDLMYSLGKSVSNGSIPYRVLNFSQVFDSPEREHPQPPSLVLLTLPPGASNVSELLAHLQRSVDERVPVILLGGQLDAGLLHQPGVFALLEDPLDLDRLQALIAELMTRRDKHILLANSNPDLRLLMKRGLEREGFEVDDLDHGNLVLLKLSQQAYDLLVVDHPLSDISGIELVKHVRKDSKYDHLQIVVTSKEKEMKVPERTQFIPSFRGLDVTIKEILNQLTEAHRKKPQ